MTTVSASVTVTVPFAVRKRGGRKLIITPDGTSAKPQPRVRVDSALLKALARGFRWRKMLEASDFTSIEEIAEAENINPSYVSRVLRMTLLAPEIVEAILAGKQPEGLTMARAMQPFPIEWKHQQTKWHDKSFNMNPKLIIL
ncbi:hypothetical protein [Aestuariivirga sp.]|uniref:hypothetical protein n=1 Tax=Aestuariivirga sp. TaxID=2650926 RepID=UPI003593B190